MHARLIHRYTARLVAAAPVAVLGAANFTVASILHPRPRTARVILAVALAGLMTGACENKGSIVDVDVATIVVTPNPVSMGVGATQQFTAVAKDGSGNVVTITPVWSVVNAGGTIDASTGLFTAGTTTGTFANTVQASSGGVTGSATVTVTAGPLATIVVTPNPATMGVGAAQTFTAVGKDAAGNVVAITPTWSVVASGGSINATTGLFTAGTVAGAFANTVKATSGTISGTATVNVTAGPLATIVVTPNPATMAVGATQTFAAVGKDAAGNVVTITPAWSIVNGGGSINAGTGVFTAGAADGTFSNTVRATSGGISGTATVIVTGGPVATIIVTPNPVSMLIGTTQQFTAVGKDASGNVVAITPSWSVGSGGGTVNSTGLFTAGTATGTYTNTIRASSGGITGTATVIVTAGPLATIVVLPNPATMSIGATHTFVAVGRDAAGNIVAVTPTWSVVNGGGSINASTGLFDAGMVAATFENTIQASSGGITGTATVIVTPGPLAKIVVTPNPGSVAVNATQQFTAVGKDASNNVVAITPVWSVVNGGGSINAGTGLFTAGAVTGAFANTVKATSGTISGTATVNVTPGPLATITVTPNPGSVVVNATQQFTAVGKDANNNLVAITPVWSVVNGGGSINAGTGLFTAGTVAATFANTVKATSGAISGTATVNVTPGPLATITVTPNPVTLAAFAAQQFTAVGKDANNNLVAITPVWSVVDGGGAINSSTGRFTAGGVAGTFSNTVKAASGTVSGFATVTVTVAANILGSAAPYGIMAGTAVTCTTGDTIHADVAISPGSTITAPECVEGVQHLGDAIAAQAQLDLTAAYDSLFGLPCPAANIVATLGGTTKTAGVYCSPSSTMGVTGVVTLDGGGDPDAIFVFQVGTGLTTAGDVVLINSAQAKNVYWVIGSSATIGTASKWQGNIIALTSITMVTDATLLGRALARNGAVTLGTHNVITLP